MVQIVQVGKPDVKPGPSRASKPKEDGEPNEKEKPVRKNPARAPKRKRPAGDEQETNGDNGEPTMKIIVGIDFGTTYSGAAFVDSMSTQDDIAVVDDWPGQGENDVKVPTRLRYDPESFELQAWGHQNSADALSATWFKLALTQSERSVDQDDPVLVQYIQNELQNHVHGKSANDLARDYLERVKQHIYQKIRNRLQSDELFDAAQIIFVLTTPADWGSAYKLTLRKIAEEAGIGCRGKDRIRMMDEPEAAALAAFHVLDSWDIGVDTNVVVVDMGGGTVDIITYRILRGSGTLPFRLAEACPGTSAKCGGTSIDLQLHELMSRRYKGAFTNKDKKEIDAGSVFMENFESIKWSFKGCGAGEPTTYKLPLVMDHPWDGTYAFGMVILTSDEIAAMFDKVLNPSFDMVRRQERNATERTKLPVHKIILCGGLASSPYIKQQFKKFCRDEYRKKIRVIVPREPWDAVARGAAIYGLNAKSIVRDRVCRQSYGISIHKAFDPRVDSEEDAFHCPESGKRARGYMHWYIRRGEHIEDGKAKAFRGFIVIDKANGSKGEMVVYQSYQSNPGRRVFDKDVTVLGRFSLDFASPKFRKTSGLFSQSVVVYHKIIPDTEMVHFEAKTGNHRSLGHGQFDYEVIGLSMPGEDDE